ncbi:MAG: hypothetical protein UZ17_ACD001002411 [Acidobacteria bacterium OLB17]|nr:MAG: hypothetical protein UZ17_ACD001002411 [Acidobacteria bacterium OLB17]
MVLVNMISIAPTTIVLQPCVQIFTGSATAIRCPSGSFCSLTAPVFAVPSFIYETTVPDAGSLVFHITVSKLPLPVPLNSAITASGLVPCFGDHAVDEVIYKLFAVSNGFAIIGEYLFF